MIDEFKQAIKKLKIKKFTKSFYETVNISIEKRYEKCLESDKKFKINNDRMNKKFDV